MKKLLLLSFVFLLSFSIYSQCPVNQIILTSQAEVDSFAATYPGCTAISDGLIISGSDINNLLGLSGITQITGGFSINNNPLLESLNGLENLTIITISGNFTIRDNTLLSSISALSSLSGPVGYSLEIINNPSLQSLNGLQNVTSPGDDDLHIENNDLLINLNGLEGMTSADDVVLWDNDALISLTGLNNFEFTGDLLIWDNDVLETLDGLSSLNMIYDLSLKDNLILNDISELTDTTIVLDQIFEVTNNPNLSNCSIESVCFRLANNQGTIIISNNAIGCNNEAEVIANCPSCPTTLITLTTQTEVDAFAINYPDCTEIANGLTIDGNNINDLNSLSNIQTIDNGLIIENTNNLLSFQGLENLLSVDVLSILNNEDLVDLSALESLDTSVLSVLTITGNSNLTDCNIFSVCNFLDNEGTVIVNNNSFGCNSLSQLEEKCFTYFNDIVLTSQVQVNSFSNDFPLFHIFANITIGGSTITSLAPLSQIESLMGVLEIKNNPNLQTLNGLENLIGNGLGTTIENNPMLQNFDALDSFWHSGSYFHIVNNDALINLSGLENLLVNSGGGDVLRIEENDNLINFEGIGPLTYLGGLRIQNNDSLESLIGITGFTGPTLNIQGNPMLSNCSIESICEYLNDGWSLDGTVQNNLNGCNSIIEIEENCEPLSIDDFELFEELLVFPNPVSEILTISVSENISINKVSVYSILGNKLLETPEGEVDFSTYNSGIYFVEVRTNQGVIYKKVIKE